MELSIRTHAGMGDVLHSKQLLDEIKCNYDLINIYFDTNYLKDYKGNYEQFNEFTVKLLEELFSEPPYGIRDTPNSITLPPMQLCSYIQSKFKVLNLEEYFCKDFIDIEEDEDYVVVLTKIRGFEYHNYCLIRDNYLNILNEISKKTKIYIMGERKIGMNKENIIHGPQKIYSIYDDLIQNVSNTKDLTVEELGISSPKYDDFLVDCKIMNKSKNVICFGISGAVDMAMSVSRIINYYGNTELEKMFDLMEKQENKYLTNNINDFFNKLESLI
jgi:hypothetical protein